MRLLLDEQIDKLVAERLRARGFDAVAVTEDEHLIQMADGRLLEHADRDRRAVVTYDVADFRALAGQRLADEEHHFGLLLLNPRRFREGKRHVGALVAALRKLLEDMPADDALVDREVWPGS